MQDKKKKSQEQDKKIQGKNKAQTGQGHGQDRTRTRPRRIKVIDKIGQGQDKDRSRSGTKLDKDRDKTRQDRGRDEAWTTLQGVLGLPPENVILQDFNFTRGRLYPRYKCTPARFVLGQCGGSESGSAESTCFWASRIRIH